MPTLYRYQTSVTGGPNGSTLRYRNTDDDDATELGAIDGWHYVSVPDGIAMPEQPVDIQWQAVTPDAALTAQLKRLRPFAIAKDVTRRDIAEASGDIHDLLADSMRMTEFALALSLRLGREVLGGAAMDQATKDSYLARIEAVLNGMESGEILIRGDIENTDEMMNRLMSRYTRINQIVRDGYKPRVDSLIPSA